MADEFLHGDFVIDDEVGSLHRKILEQVAYAVATIQRTPDDVIET